MRAPLAGLLAAALLVGAPAVSAAPRDPESSPGPSARQSTPDSGWEAEVRELLDRRAAAVRGRDREAFLATVDPEASEAFRARQGRLFDGLATVPLDAYRLELASEDVHDLSAAVPAERRREADEVRLPAVEEHLRITGVDGVDAVHDLWLTFARRDDRWYVHADEDVADLGLLTQRNLWDFGPVTFTESSRVAVVSAPDGAERAEALLEITEEAVGRLRGGLDWAVPPKVLVVLPSSADQLEEILQTNFDLSNFVAFATADVDRSDRAGGWAWTSPRVYAQEDNLARHGRDFQVETLHHELVHVAAFDRAGPHVPNWLHEGHADYLALGRPGSRPVEGSDGTLPLDHQFVTGDRSSILRSYRESTSAVAFLAEAVGPTAPSELFERLGAVRVEPGTWEHHLDRALEDVYGSGTEAFESDWAGGG